MTTETVPVNKTPSTSPAAKAAAPLDRTKLPSPADRPNADIVLYDGQCKFCLAQVSRLNRWDWTGRLAFLSLHDPSVAERWPQLTHEQLMKEMYIVAHSGQDLPRSRFVSLPQPKNAKRSGSLPRSFTFRSRSRFSSGPISKSPAAATN